VSTTDDRARPETGTYVDAQSSRAFVGLRSRFRGWVFPVTVAFLAWYLLYVVMSAWARIGSAVGVQAASSRLPSQVA
jgi:uncharacterized membrane protein (DUF485 family)